MHLSPGTLLQGGKYRIIRILGQGGFGITYLGEQVGLGRKVAIKEFFMRDYCNRDRGSSHISIGSTGSLEMVERFRQKFVKEAQIIATLKHHHIINIYDIFEENKTAYYVMEYIDSGSLSEKIGENGIKEQEALHYIRQVASALSYIHNKDMNHLDVKPGNILIDEDNNAILIDFGLAKHYDEKGKQTTTTPVGISHGYAPAEQYVMGGVSVFTPTTDIYSLGATLYKMLTGDTPPDANIVNEEGLPPLPMHITSATRYAVTQAMQPRRKDRPQSIADFLALLDGKVVDDDEKTNIGSDLGGGCGNNRGGSTAGEETNLGVGGNGNNGETQPGGGGNNGGTTPKPQPVPTPKPQPTPKRKLKWLWAAVAAVVLGIVGYLVAGGQEDIIEPTTSTHSINSEDNSKENNETNYRKKSLEEICSEFTSPVAISDAATFTTELKPVSDSTVELIINATIEDGFHLYTSDTEGTMPASVGFDALVGAELDGELQNVGEVHSEYEDAFEATTRYFVNKGQYVLRIKITDLDHFEIVGYFEAQACQEGGLYLLDTNFSYTHHQ